MLKNMIQMPQSQFTLDVEGGENGGGGEVKGFLDISKEVFKELNPGNDGPKGSEAGKQPPAATDDPAGKTEKTPGQNGEEGAETDEAVLAWAKSLDAQTREDIKAGRTLPHHRFKEMQEKYRAYEQFGTPESLQELKRSVEKYREFGSPENLKKILETSKREPEPKKAEPELSDEDKQARDYFLKAFPELKKVLEGDPQLLEKLGVIEKDINDIKAKSHAEMQARSERIVKSAENKVRELAKAKGLDVTDARKFDIICDNVAALVNADPDLKRQFWAEGNVEALAKPFEEYYAMMFSGSQVKAAADILSAKKNEGKISKSPIKEGAETPPPKDDISKKSFAQITREALRSS